MARADGRIAREIASECVGARVRTLSRVISRIYDEHLRPLDVKFSQMNILVVVTSEGPIAPGRVAALLGLDKSTLSRNLRVLEASGWVEARPGESANSLLLRATAKGRRLVERAGPLWRAAQREVTAKFGDDTADAILRAFARYREGAVDG